MTSAEITRVIDIISQAQMRTARQVMSRCGVDAAEAATVLHEMEDAAEMRRASVRRFVLECVGEPTAVH